MAYVAFASWKGGDQLSDNQTLSFDASNNILSISDGNSVSLATSVGSFDTANVKDLYIMDQATGLNQEGHLYESAPGAVTLQSLGFNTVNLQSGQTRISLTGGGTQDVYTNTTTGNESLLRTTENAFGNTEIVRIFNGVVSSSDLEFDQTDVIVRGRELVRGAAQTLGGLQLNPDYIAITDPTAANTVSMNLTGTDFQFVPKGGSAKTAVLSQDGDWSVQGNLSAQGDLYLPFGDISGGGNITVTGTVEGQGIVATNTALCGDFYGEVNINRANSFLRAVPNVNDTVVFTTSASPSGWLNLTVANVPDNAGFIRIEMEYYLQYGFSNPFAAPNYATYQAGDPVNPARGAKRNIIYNYYGEGPSAYLNVPQNECWTFVRGLDWVGNTFTLTVVSGYQSPGTTAPFTQTFDVATIF